MEPAPRGSRTERRFRARSPPRTGRPHVSPRATPILAHIANGVGPFRSCRRNHAMSQPLIVSIPHRLGREEAKRRLDSGISRIRPELAGLVSTLDYSWDQDRLNFRAVAVWQTITGAIEVLDDVVSIEIDLPWMMRLLGETIMKQVRGRGIAMLEKPPGEG